MQMQKALTSNAAILGIYRLLVVFSTILTLYFARTIVIPLIIAALFTFLLAPLVSKLEKWIGRVLSIIIVVLLVFSLIGFVGYIFAHQLILFGADFPKYYENIQVKIESFHLPESGFLNEISHFFGRLKDQLVGKSPISEPLFADIKLVNLGPYITNFAELLFGSFFSLVATTGIVLLLVIFMLLNREDIGSRVIKLMGQNRISSATTAMIDAGERVFAYLSRLFIVNACFGVCVAIGLYFIGIPNAILWGCFAAIMRFIPYLGSWIAAILPILLSFIVTDSWVTPLLTTSFFIILEVTTAYVIEPFYYGAGTGVSSFALILAAIFWTWLWGPIGLLLSTPLTVCLVVLGQYVTNMSFLRVLLSQEQPLTPVEEFYHRFLMYDSNESMDDIEAYLKENSLISFYDSVLIPIITQTERDFYAEIIDEEKKEAVYRHIREIIEFLSGQKYPDKKREEGIGKGNTVLCLSTRALRDELGTQILAQFLTYEAFNVLSFPKNHIQEAFDFFGTKKPKVVFINAVAPVVFSQLSFLCAKLLELNPDSVIFIALWGYTDIAPEVMSKLNSLGATKIVFTLSEAIKALQEFQAIPN
jgi:predicted PurR-regulated permease PerM